MLIILNEKAFTLWIKAALTDSDNQKKDTIHFNTTSLHL